MLTRHSPPLHLTYCLNVHPGETWPEVQASIETHAASVRRSVAAGSLFGLGLRLGRRALDDLAAPEARQRLRELLVDNGLYVFTANGFPFGTFHGQAVKTEVYRPDWTDRRRLDYTRDLADLLAPLLPEGVDGSISTLPLSYKAWPLEAAAEARLYDHLAALVVHLHGLRERSGREIHVGFEPEPDCTLETTPETIAWFEGPLAREGVPRVAALLQTSLSAAHAIVRRHLGVCVDTCHLAIQFESLPRSLAALVSRGIRISKIQISAALETGSTPEARADLAPFCDPVYLHQVKARPEAAPAPLIAYADLPAALASTDPAPATWRIHFHVPLYFEAQGRLRSTAPELDGPFWRAVAAAPVSHLEIETYTFHVLPPSLQSGGVARSVAREFEWVLPRLTAATSGDAG